MRQNDFHSESLLALYLPFHNGREIIYLPQEEKRSLWAFEMRTPDSAGSYNKGRARDRRSPV
jgi:hypothetical protein